MLNTLISSGAGLVAGLLIAWFSSWLAKRARARTDQAADLAALAVQADALIVAVAELRATAELNRILWERTTERARTFLLASLTALGRAAHTRALGGSETEASVAGFGGAADLLSRERCASKGAVAAVRGPMTRVAAAAAPLIRHQDQDVADTAGQLLDAAYDTTATAQLDAAMHDFGQAVRQASRQQPRRRPLRLGRRRNSATPPEAVGH